MSECNCKSLPPIQEKDIERFWKYVDRRGPDECWPWIGARSDRGYGVFEMPTTTVRAQRVAWYVQRGEDPYPLIVRHKCNYPPCQNAAHLLIGSHQNNVDDAVRDGLMPTEDRNGSRTHPEKLKRGSSHGMSKLTEESVEEARRLNAQGMECGEIAERLGVHLSTVARAIKGKTWDHVKEEKPVETLHRRGSDHKGSRLNDELVREIRAKKENGKTYESLAKEYGVGVYTLFALVSRKTWKHVK